VTNYKEAVGMNEKDVYRALQMHLDEETICFPATKSGSDIRVLKTLFTPEQAEIATILTYRYNTLEEICERAVKIGKSPGEIERILESAASRGVIGHRRRGGTTQYRNIPYLVGMLEAAASNPTPEFLTASAEYREDGLFGRVFVGTKVPQMRTIPVGVSVEVQHRVATYDAIRQIIQATVDPIVIIECVCRKGAADRGEPCKKTSREETCMAFRDGAKNLIETGKPGRQITKDEALDILRKNEEEGLVLQPSNAQEPDFICSCCGCCCGILRMHKALPNPVTIWATNFYAEVNEGLCSACSTCLERCQTGAMKLNDEGTASVVDLTRCLGCGLCVAACPTGAIELRRKEHETVPPSTGEEMMEVIMAHKRARA
jgi:Na+-translocating ferredoxin:NAD+ oxidoreductase subunit B